MSQNLAFSIAGINTSSSDLNGLLPGALDVADNLEVRYKNVAQPRRGFGDLPNSEQTLLHYIRMTNFYISGTNRGIALQSDRSLTYYTGTIPWPAVPGSVSDNIIAPDAISGKCKFISAGSNLYVTAQDGVRSLSSGSTAQMIYAGVPKGLNLLAATNASTSGFFSNNSALTTTATVTSGSNIIKAIADPTGIVLGQYVSTDPYLTDPTAFPVGTVVTSIDLDAVILITTANATIGSTTLASTASVSGLAVGQSVTGNGVLAGTVITALPGAGNVTISNPAVQTLTAATYTFSNNQVVVSANAIFTQPAIGTQFFGGAQVGYRMVFGRVETDINNQSITRLGSPSSITIATNISKTSTNVGITGTIPKNSSDQVQFVQLYRSPQTPLASVVPLDQYNLVYEAQLTGADFTARVVTVTDSTPDSLVGIPLYCGSDQEGILQANDPPPMCWDMATFRDFSLFGNCTQPTTAKFTILAVGSPSGLQIGDTITLSGTFTGILVAGVYTAASSENQAAKQFKVYSAGTPSQNVADTAASLIRVINYDNSCPIHAILLSTSTDLPGQILLEADHPNPDTFTVTASLHTAAYNPVLSGLVSTVNVTNNGVIVSKSGELEAAPSTNLLRVGNTSSPLLRLVALRDYVFAVKTDGIYKIQGSSPSSLVVNPFDLTTKILGAETAVSLNAGMWMLSNQGIVSVSDGGVEIKSIPIDDQLSDLINNHLDNLTDSAFALGYESDRKYILFTPTSDNPWAQIEYNFNYTTNAFTTWSRDFYTAFIHSIENRIYVARADAENKGVSRERKTGTYQDFVDEGVVHAITHVNGNLVTLDSVADVAEGDILYQSDTLFSPILAVDLVNSIITIQYELAFTVAACSVLKAFLCDIVWKQVFGDNPAFMRQFSEGMALFKNTRFNTASAVFVTDFSGNKSSVRLTATGNALWGLFRWGEQPWGGSILPRNIRFLIPQDKQIGSYLLPQLKIQQGYSDFKLQGLSISFENISQEAGL